VDFLTSVVVFPIVAMLLAGLLFIHVGLRRMSSLISLVSLSLLVAWNGVAHWVVHEYVIGPGDAGIERMGGYSAHPMFDVIATAVSIILTITLGASLFMSAISISTLRIDGLPPPGEPGITARLGTRTLWVVAVLSMVLAFLGANAYRHIAAVGSSAALGVISAIIALCCLACGVLLFAIAIRRRMIRRSVS
jgi:hypothetical protein